MNKNIFITLLISLLLLSGCSGDTCIDPDDFGFIKFNISSRYDAAEVTSRQQGDQVAPWRDSAYRVNGYPLTVMVRPWSYMLGDKNKSGQLSAWCPWYGQKDHTTTLADFCVKLQPCRFIDDNMCPTPPKNDAPIINAPCIMINGVGLYFLIAAKNTDPNMSPDSQRNPSGITRHLGDLSQDYTFYSISSTGQFLQAGGINYQYEGEQISDYSQSPLYFKILDKFYDDNSGQYRVVIKSGVSDTRPNPLQFLTGLIKNVLFGTGDQDPGIIRQTFQQIIDTPGYRMSVSALLTLYIMFTGFSFLIGNINLTHVELIVRVLKVSIVSILLSSSKAWTFFNDYLFVFFVDGVAQILQIIGDASGPDLLNLLISPQTLSKLFSLLFVDPLGFIYIILYFIALYFIFFLLFKATIIYLTALITIGMIIIMAPIFICFMLFNITRSLFENWLRQLISYALQPIILFTGIAFISMIIRTEIYSTLGFGVCKRDFPNLGPINVIFGSFLEDLDPSLGDSIFYWWFPVPMKGGINNFHKAEILVPEDYIK
ncbi:MAG TPA: type IV secretion system protein, partial [Rickettsia endosymbiont of Pyrocoelia pectoralis]|nr:type IV secretion system protein [Rickettsia endosymbiont of Pyrocoelia pectoralis]